MGFEFRRFLGVCGCALLIAGFCATAMADDLDKARIYYKKGNDLFDKGRFLEAITEFRTALRYAPRVPAIHKNLARTYMTVKEWKLAIKHFNDYLKLRPNAKDVAKIGREKQKCLQMLGVSSEAELLARQKGSFKLTVSIENAEVLINDRPFGTSPMKLVLLKPGQYQLTVKKKGFKTQVRPFTIEPGQKTAMFVELPKVEPIVVKKPVRKVRKKKANLRWIFAWVTAGTGVAFLVTGAVMNVLATKDQNSILNAERNQFDSIIGKTQSDARNAENSAKTKNIVGYVMYGLAAASIGVSVWLFLTYKKGDQERLSQPTLNFSPSPVQGGMVFTLDGRF